MAKSITGITVSEIRKIFKEELSPVKDNLVETQKRVLGLERRSSDTENTVQTMHTELHRVERILENIAASQIKLQDELRDSFREFQSLIQGLVDPIMGELIKNREEQTLLNGRSAKINHIEEKLEKLERIHPQNQHALA